jgi:hypothetical protein
MDPSGSPNPPDAYKQAGLFMMISGIMHLMVGGLTVLTGLGVCVGTYGLCCFCPALGVVPMVIGIHELIVASQMQQGRWIASARGTNLSALIVSVITLSMINIVLEALAMAQLNQPDVVAFLEQGGSSQMDWS